MKIGAAIMAHNMAPLIGAVVHSLSWVDGLYILDDNSSDKSGDIAKAFARIPIVIEKSTDHRLAFEREELEARNYTIDQAFEVLRCDMLVLIDADELLSELIRPIIEKTWREKKYESILFTTWHLYTPKAYLHFWETKINGAYLIDPHNRIITRDKRYKRLFPDGSHPIIHPTEKTFCLHGPYHFHLKYFHKSPYPNYALNFLPKRLTYKSVKPYLRPLPFVLPDDIKNALSLIKWGSLKRVETKYYKFYQTKRTRYSNHQQALCHPRDKNKPTKT